MLRISYRYVLPLLALMVTAALYFAGQRQQQGIEPASWDGPPPRPIEIAIALNIPAAIAALPGGLLFELATGGLDHPSRTGWHEIIGNFYLAAFVFGPWFMIGRWLDRRRDPLPSSRTRSVLKSSRIILVAALGGSLFFVCFGIWHMNLSGWTSTWIQGAGVTTWGSIAAFIFALHLRRLFAPVGE
jgi:hypothetical protein